MRVYILEYRRNMNSDYYRRGTYATAELAYYAITGDDVDYERISDTEEMFETSDGYWFLTVEEVINV